MLKQLILPTIVLSFFAIVPACAPELHVTPDTSSSSSGGTAGAGGMSVSTSSGMDVGSSSSTSTSSSGGSSGMLGAPCNVDNQCASGVCADDVCCNQQCDLPCTKCDQSGSLGSCSPVRVGTDDCSKTGELCNAMAQCACGVAKPPSGVNCPAPWVNGPSLGSCVMKCDVPEACRSIIITCPQGFDCNVECSGTKGCQDATILCPSGNQCDVSCTGSDGCRSAQIQCSGDGPCNTTCGVDNGTCTNTTIVCGDNACVATCAGGNKPGLKNNGSSCGPDGC